MRNWIIKPRELLFVIKVLSFIFIEIKSFKWICHIMIIPQLNAPPQQIPTEQLQ